MADVKPLLDLTIRYNGEHLDPKPKERPRGFKRKATYAVEYAFDDDYGWAFISRHTTLKKASLWIHRIKKNRPGWVFRIVSDLRDENTTKVDRTYYDYILLPRKRKPRKKYPTRAGRFKYRPHRFDLMWRSLGGEWKKIETFKKRKKALAKLKELEESWVGTGIEGKVHYRREDLSGRTYYEQGVGFI